MQERLLEIAGVQVRLTSYAVGKRFSCRIDNIDPGGNIARATGASREEAESSAVESANLSLQLQSSRAAMKEVTAKIGQSTPVRGVRRSGRKQDGDLDQ